MGKTKYCLNYPKYWKDIPQEERDKGRCGAGEGLGEKIVPDYILGVFIRPACQVHDKDWSPEWNPDIQEALKITDQGERDFRLMEIFHKSNQWFKENILIIINNESANWFMIWARSSWATRYYNAVELARNLFWAGIERYKLSNGIK